MAIPHMDGRLVLSRSPRRSSRACATRARMPSADVVIALRGVRKDYRGLRPLRVEQLKLRQGESVALMGFDRVAAEVLVNLITGATLPDSGEVDVFGTPTGAITDPDAWLVAMDQFGILSERVVLLESFSVEQNLALPFSLEFDEIPLTVRTSVRQLADEVGIALGPVAARGRASGGGCPVARSPRQGARPRSSCVARRTPQHRAVTRGSAAICGRPHRHCGETSSHDGCHDR